MTQLKDLKKRIEKAKYDYDLAYRQMKEEEVFLSDIRNTLTDTLNAQAICQKIGQSLQESAHQQVSEIVTRCLLAVFGEDAYEFGITFEEKRGRTEASPFLKRGEVLITDPLNEAGGGVCDVVSFALRLASLLLSRPPKRKILVLDEPFKGIRGKKYQDKVGELILALSEETGVQFLISSDFPWLRMGEMIDLND